MRSRSRAKSTPNSGPAFGPTSGPPFNSVGVRKRKRAWRTARSAGSESRLITDGGAAHHVATFARWKMQCAERLEAGAKPVELECIHAIETAAEGPPVV